MRWGLLLTVVGTGCGRLGFDPVNLSSDGPPAESCETAPQTCGPMGTSSCCESPAISSATFFRSYDGVGFDDMSNPAHVSAFRLDKYEITIGRFRQFVDAGFGTRTTPPPVGAGSRALNGLPDQGGWEARFDTGLVTDTANLRILLRCEENPTWTDTPGSDEDLPMACITWYEAMAFCIYDGGFLPTEAEWNYAASGGSLQRAYPWSDPPTSLAVDCSRANYFDGQMYCFDDPFGGPNPVGSESPEGDGLFGHSDLGGNVLEWVLDMFDPEYLNPCDDCANLFSNNGRMIRSSSYGSVGESFLRVGFRTESGEDARGNALGARCARPL